MWLIYPFKYSKHFLFNPYILHLCLIESDVPARDRASIIEEPRLEESAIIEPTPDRSSRASRASRRSTAVPDYNEQDSVLPDTSLQV